MAFLMNCALVYEIGNLFNASAINRSADGETLLVIHSPQLAQHFTREMDRLWDGAELGITPQLQRKLNRQKFDAEME